MSSTNFSPGGLAWGDSSGAGGWGTTTRPSATSAGGGAPVRQSLGADAQGWGDRIWGGLGRIFGAVGDVLSVDIGGSGSVWGVDVTGGYSSGTGGGVTVTTGGGTGGASAGGLSSNTQTLLLVGLLVVGVVVLAKA